MPKYCIVVRKTEMLKMLINRAEAAQIRCLRQCVFTIARHSCRERSVNKILVKLFSPPAASNEYFLASPAHVLRGLPRLRGKVSSTNWREPELNMEFRMGPGSMQAQSPKNISCCSSSLMLKGRWPPRRRTSEFGRVSKDQVHGTRAHHATATCAHGGSG